MTAPIVFVTAAAVYVAGFVATWLYLWKQLGLTEDITDAGNAMDTGLAAVFACLLAGLPALIWPMMLIVGVPLFGVSYLVGRIVKAVQR